MLNVYITECKNASNQQVLQKVFWYLVVWVLTCIWDLKIWFDLLS